MPYGRSAPSSCAQPACRGARSTARRACAGSGTWPPAPYSQRGLRLSRLQPRGRAPVSYRQDHNLWAAVLLVLPARAPLRAAAWSLLVVPVCICSSLAAAHYPRTTPSTTTEKKRAREAADDVSGQLQARHSGQQRVGHALKLRGGVLAAHGAQHRVRPRLHRHVQVREHRRVVQRLRRRAQLPQRLMLPPSCKSGTLSSGPPCLDPLQATISTGSEMCLVRTGTCMCADTAGYLGACAAAAL